MNLPILRLGSLTARLDAPASLGADVAYIFGTSLKQPSPALLARVDVDITISSSSATGPATVPAVPPDGMVVRHGDPRSEIHTEALSVTIERQPERGTNRLDRGSARGTLENEAPIADAVHPLQPAAAVHVFVRRDDLPHYDLCVHLAVVFHKILFLLDRIVLHAAAVRVEGKLAIFIGERGAGKTTTAMALSRAGGTVLGEDHLILRRSADGFLVSGCDERWRFDARTERHFFEHPLDLAAADYAGRLKKEVAVRAGGRSRPFTDDRPAQLFFMRAGSRFQIRPLPRSMAVLRLMEAAGRLQRFVDSEDRQRFLAMLSDFVPTITPYTLERGDDLADLDLLIGFLRAGKAGVPA